MDVRGKRPRERFSQIRGRQPYLIVPKILHIILCLACARLGTTIEHQKPGSMFEGIQAASSTTNSMTSQTIRPANL
jgi:hypothetical protein